MRILIIDDDPVTESEVEAALAGATEQAVDVVFADSDQQALAALHAEPGFDIAVVSIDGGRVSGLGIFRRVMERSLRIPRLALTHGDDITRIRAAIADGAADILVRPLATDDFVASLSRVMERVERRRQNWNERAAYSALRREIDIAADMQQRILPHEFPQRGGLDVAAAMHPARGIGGDFYDMFEIDDDRVGLLIADVSGKGIPAAFYMAIASTALRSVGMVGEAPAACLGEVNEFLVRRNIPGMFVSVFLAVLDTRDFTLRCANAGHPPPLLLRDDSDDPQPFECAGGPVLGILDGQRFEESSLALAPGDALALYTDGVTEALDAEGQQLGLEGLARLMVRTRNDAALLVSDIENGVSAFAAGLRQHDDITAVALRRGATARNA